MTLTNIYNNSEFFCKSWNINPSIIESSQFLYPEIFLFFSILYLIVWIAINNSKIDILALHRFTNLVLALTIFLNLINPIKFYNSKLFFNEFLIINDFSISAKLIFLSLMIFINLNSTKIFWKLKLTPVISFRYFEYNILFLLIAFFGSMLIMSFDLIVMYLTMEGISLLLFIILLSHGRSAATVEAGVKYFCFSVFTASFIGFGISIIYGTLHSTNFWDIQEQLLALLKSPNEKNIFLVEISILFILIGFLFKLGSAPFHNWVPEVYSGNNGIITSILIIPIKILFFFILCRLTAFVFLPFLYIWQPFFLVSALTSIVIGTLGAIWQVNLKKFMAYTSINQIGFSLLAIASSSVGSFIGAFFNLFFYSVANIAFFSFLFNTHHKSNGREIETINELSAFANRYPQLGITLVIIILSMAGIPPLAGFWGKFLILCASVEAGFLLLSGLALIVTVISAFYYIRLFKNIFFDTPLNLNYQVSKISSIDHLNTLNLFEFIIPRFTIYFSSILLLGVIFNINYIVSLFNEIVISVFFPFNYDSEPLKSDIFIQTAYNMWDKFVYILTTNDGYTYPETNLLSIIIFTAWFAPLCFFTLQALCYLYDKKYPNKSNEFPKWAQWFSYHTL